jgi:hypothetical protein
MKTLKLSYYTIPTKLENEGNKYLLVHEMHLLTKRWI